MAQRKLGISAFVSVGNRADVSGEDLLQFWGEDAATSAVLMYLESLSNPAKFMRVVRAVTRRKPVVVVRSGRTSQAFPLGTRPRRTELPAYAVDQLMRNAGVIETESLGQLIDVGGLLACQPLPTGKRVAVVGDSHELVLLTADTCTTAGLDVAETTVVLGADVAGEVHAEIARVIHDGGADAIVVVHVPPARSNDQAVRSSLVAAAASATVPVLAVLHAEEGNNSLLLTPGSPESAAHGSVPFFGTVEEAVQSLRRVSDYARWRSRPRGEVPQHSDIDSETARVLVAESLVSPDRTPQSPTVPLVGSRLRDLLACYGVDLWESLPVSSEDEAVAEADQLGWPVVLKTVDPRLARRGDYVGIRLNLENEQSLRSAFLSMAASLDQEAMNQLVVQRMAPPGVHCVLRSVEDALFGPVLSFGLGGAIPELLHDRAHQVPPISDIDAARLLRQPKAASILLGYGGRDPVDIVKLEDLVTRVGRMAEELPELARLDLNPILVSSRGLAVLSASAWLRSAEVRRDAQARRLSDL